MLLSPLCNFLVGIKNTVKNIQKLSYLYFYKTLHPSTRRHTRIMITPSLLWYRQSPSTTTITLTSSATDRNGTWRDTKIRKRMTSTISIWTVLLWLWKTFYMVFLWEDTSQCVPRLLRQVMWPGNPYYQTPIRTSSAIRIWVVKSISGRTSTHPTNHRRQRPNDW